MADEILNDLLEAREELERNNSVRTKRAYDRAVSKCLKEFDFLIQNRLGRYRKFSNAEDLQQEGRVALFRALNTYKKDRGNFFYWARWYINTKISRQANTHSSLKIPIEKAREVQPHKVAVVPMIVDESPNALELFGKKQLSENVRYAIGQLPQPHRRVVEMYYSLDGKKHYLKNICKELNIKRKQFDQVLEQANDRLRQSLDGL